MVRDQSLKTPSREEAHVIAIEDTSPVIVEPPERPADVAIAPLGDFALTP